MLGELTTNIRREKMDKVFIVARLQPRSGNKGFFPIGYSSIIKVMSNYEKAKDFWVQMEGECLDGPLIIKEMAVNENGMIEI